MHIFIETQTGEVKELEVELNDTMDVLKIKISTLLGIPHDKFQIKLEGKLLDNKLNVQ